MPRSQYSHCTVIDFSIKFLFSCLFVYRNFLKCLAYIASLFIWVYLYDVASSEV